MAEVEGGDIPKVIGGATKDSEDEDKPEKTKRKPIDIDAVMSRVKAKSAGRKKWSSPLLQNTAKAAAKESLTSTEDTANKKTAKKEKKKTKVVKSPEKSVKSPEKSVKSKERPKKEGIPAKFADVLDEDEFELQGSSDESDGEISIPFVIEVLADSTHDEQARAADVEKESKKHESMHNSHNALRVLERADSGKSLKKMAKSTRHKPTRTRSINAQQALERVNSSTPLSKLQREAKARERNLRPQGRKRPTAATANPRRAASLSAKNAGPSGILQQTKSMDAAKALLQANNEELKELYGAAQRKTDRERRQRGGEAIETSSRRSKRSIDDDLDDGFGTSLRSHGRSIDDDFEASKRGSRRSYGTGRSLDDEIDDSKRGTSSRRTQRSIEIEWDDDVGVGNPSSKHSIRSVDVGSPDAESKKRAATRRAKRESHRAASNQTNEVLQRADSGKSLKDIANDSRRRRSTSVGSHKGGHKRTNSTGPRSRRGSVTNAPPEGGQGGGGPPTDSMRMKEIEAQIKAEEKELKGSS